MGTAFWALVKVAPSGCDNLSEKGAFYMDGAVVWGILDGVGWFGGEFVVASHSASGLGCY
jgi:hypothetical protein